MKNNNNNNNAQPTRRVSLSDPHTRSNTRPSYTCSPAVAWTPLDNKRHRNKTACLFRKKKQHQTSNINAAVIIIILNIPLFRVIVGISRKNLNVMTKCTGSAPSCGGTHAQPFHADARCARSSVCATLSPAEGDKQGDCQQR